MRQKKVWLITGVSSGFGRAIAKAVLNQGDKVMATFRKDTEAAEFTTKHEAKEGMGFVFDVTDFSKANDLVNHTLKTFGRIDVLVNNAGFGYVGAIEELSLDEAEHQMDVNFFGPLNLTQYVLPVMRGQRGGTIVQMSSVAGFCSQAGAGLYNASKYALEGFSEALAKEVKPLNIKVLIVEPGPFRTRFMGSSSLKQAQKKIDDYETTAHPLIKRFAEIHGKQEGDPDKAAAAILTAVNSEHMPLRLPLGKSAIEGIREKIDSVEKDIAQWETISLKTKF